MIGGRHHPGVRDPTLRHEALHPAGVRQGDGRLGRRSHGPHEHLGTLPRAFEPPSAPRAGRIGEDRDGLAAFDKREDIGRCSWFPARRQRHDGDGHPLRDRPSHGVGSRLYTQRIPEDGPFDEQFDEPGALHIPHAGL